MKTQPQTQSSYPVVQLYRPGQPAVEATVYGTSQDRRQVLVGVSVPMTERHLNGGLIQSQVPLVDERGQPKRISTYRMFAYCGVHQTAWEGDDRCPVCEKNETQRRRQS